MKALKELETKLEQFFKGFPPLSNSSRETLVGAWPWIALIFGILQLFAAWTLWGLVRSAEKILEYSSFYVRYPVELSGADKVFVYLGILILLVDGIILLMAYPELKKRARRGWNLLFLGALLNLLYSVVSLFIRDRGLGSFLFSLIGSMVGFYLLFQVRGKYGSVKAAKNR